MPNLIEAKGLLKNFGDMCAVDRLDLHVAAGEIYGLVGPDGAGKTTTIRLLCGALHANQGQVSIADFDIVRHTEQARLQIGYLPQRFSLYEELTVLENLRFFAEVRGLPAVEWHPRCMEILTFVGMAEYVNRRAGHLSGGMKQKLGLAAALVHRPKVLLLDEPTTGVDPVTRQDFWQLIIRLVAEGSIAALVSTPYMDEAARCNRVGFLQNGRLIVEGAPIDLLKILENRIIELRGSPLPALRRIASREPMVEDAHMFGDLIHLRVSEGEVSKVIRQLKKRFKAEDGMHFKLRPVTPQLEDVFIAMLEKRHE